MYNVQRQQDGTIRCIYVNCNGQTGKSQSFMTQLHFLLAASFDPELAPRCGQCDRPSGARYVQCTVPAGRHHQVSRVIWLTSSLAQHMLLAASF